MENDRGKELAESFTKLKKAMIKFHMISGVPQPALIAMREIGRCTNGVDRDSHGIKMSEISKRMNVSRPAITQMINYLEEKGYAERVLTKNDRRVVNVCLTEAGNEVLKKCESTGIAMLNQITDSLGESDTEELIRIVNKLLTAFEGIKTEK